MKSEETRESCHAELVLASQSNCTPLFLGEEINSAKHTEKNLSSFVSHFSLKKVAFTLAEVLITLGIIGVVAAITMPTLVQNYKKHVYVNQLKKSYSTLEQAFQMMLADEGVEHLSDLSGWPSANVQNGSNNTKTFVNYLNKYIKADCCYTDSKYTIYYMYSNLPISNYITLPDGSILPDYYFYSQPEITSDSICNQIKSLGGSMCSNIGDFWIDINGKKGPNSMGRDIFWFSISNEGKLYPSGGKDTALFYSQEDLESNYGYWRTDVNHCGEVGVSDYFGYGAGCAARIMENGWKMDY